MKYKLVLILFIGLIFPRCNSKIEGEIQYIYKLSSSNGKIDIYECYIESPMSFGTGNLKKTVLKANENYNPRNPSNFDRYTILGWIGNDTLKVIKLHKKKDDEIKIPESMLHEIKKFNDFYLDIAHRTSYGGGKNWFDFDTLYFDKDSVIFLQFDSLGIVKEKLGLLKGQIRLALDNDTITKITGKYYERIEVAFEKVTEGNELGYPYIVGTYIDITPNYRLESSVFMNQPVTMEMNIKDYE